MYNGMEVHLGAVSAFNTTLFVQVDPTITVGFLALQLMGTATPTYHATGAHLDIEPYLCTGTVVFCTGTWRLRHSVTRDVETEYIYENASSSVRSEVLER